MREVKLSGLKVGDVVVDREMIRCLVLKMDRSSLIMLLCGGDGGMSVDKVESIEIKGERNVGLIGGGSYMNLGLIKGWKDMSSYYND